MSLLTWVDEESKMRFKRKFVQLQERQQVAIIKDIAYRHDKSKVDYKDAAAAFDRLKRLVLAAFFCSPQGSKDLGYMGNVPIAGDYPGPTAEAQKHLDGVLAQLGLSEYAYDMSIHS